MSRPVFCQNGYVGTMFASCSMNGKEYMVISHSLEEAKSSIEMAWNMMADLEKYKQVREAFERVEEYKNMPPVDLGDESV